MRGGERRGRDEQMEGQRDGRKERRKEPGDVAQLVNCLPRKCEDPGSDPQNPCKKSDRVGSMLEIPALERHRQKGPRYKAVSTRFRAVCTMFRAVSTRYRAVSKYQVQGS